MTDDVKRAARPTGPISAISRLSGRSQDELYRLFRLEGAPTVVTHVSGVPVYDIEASLAWLQPDSGPAADPAVPVRLTHADLPPGAPV